MSKIDDYLKEVDWRVKENSNSNYSFMALQAYISADEMVKWAFDNMYKGPIAEAHKQGFLHIHDLSHPIVGYCAGWSLEDLIREGFNADNSNVYCRPPKHLRTLYKQINNFLFTLANEWAGAQAFNSLDTYSAGYIKHENLSDEEVYDLLEGLVYDLNVKTRHGSQTPFTNFSFDLTVPDDMRGRPVMIGDTEADLTYGDCQEEMDRFNRIFTEIMIEGDGKGKPFTFPIVTYSITDKFPWGSDLSKSIFTFADECNSPYFSNFINSDNDPSDVRSMCPLTPDTEVFVKTEIGGITKRTIGEIYSNVEAKGTHYQVWNPSSGWVDGKPIQTPATKVYEITMSNGEKVKMGENHLQPIRGGEVLHADELEVGMWLPFNKKHMGDPCVGNDRIGFIVGAFLGDGSYDGKAVVYSLNSGSKLQALVEIKSIWELLGHNTTVSDSGNVTFLRVNGDAKSLIRQYVKGESALSKSLAHKVWNMNVEFKYGLVLGMKATDGAKATTGRLYTSSPKLRSDLLSLFASMGKTALGHYVDEREGRLGDNPNYRIDCMQTNTKYGNYYDKGDTHLYYSITDIQEVKPTSEYLYCFEVDCEDRLFTLANGLITHNCRLRLDLTQLINSGGGLFGSGDKTGSLGVVTINLPRLAYIAKHTKEDALYDFPVILKGDPVNDYFTLLDYFAGLARESLLIKREAVNKSLGAGLMTYTKRYLGNFDKHFNTVGVNGGHEACLNLLDQGIDSEQGKSVMTETLNTLLDLCKDWQVEDKTLLWNLEATPAEGASTRFARLDKRQFPDIITGGGDGDFYTNSTQLPDDYTDNIFEVFKHQNDLQPMYTSGTVQHIYLNEPTHNWEVIENLVGKLFTNFKLPYLSISPDITVCPICGRLDGYHEYCPNEHTEEQIREALERGIIREDDIT